MKYVELGLVLCGVLAVLCVVAFIAIGVYFDIGREPPH